MPVTAHAAPGADSLSAGNQSRPPVLIVDDEALFAKAVARKLTREGMRCDAVGTLKDAGEYIERETPALVVLDMRLPDGSGHDFLARLRAGNHPELPVVVLTAFGGLEDAVSAMKLGALDYLTKPVDLDELLVKLERAIVQAEVSQRLEYSRERERHSAGTGEHQGELLGGSPGIEQVRARIAQISRIAHQAGMTPPTVLVLGETGTGKDLAARALHQGSGRDGRPFVHLDCAALPRDLIEAELFGHEKGAFTNAHVSRTGLIEAAEDGTLFLDEVGELPLDVQSRLLAVLERRMLRRVGSSHERQVAAWFIAATNRDLEQMVREGTFRPDLYYRLNVLTVRMPPLRDRPGDAGLIARACAVRTARRFGLPAAEFDDLSLRRLDTYAWPGNVRELVNVVERAVLLASEGIMDVSALGLPGDAHPPVAGMPHLQVGTGVPVDGTAASGPDFPADITLEAAECLLIQRALDAAQGNVSQAARRLGVTRMALRYRMEKHAIT